MKLLLVFVTCSIFLIDPKVEAQNWLWAKGSNSVDGSGSEGWSIALDVSNNSYITGYCFNAGLSFDSLSTQYPGYFLAKYDLNSNIQWVIGESSESTKSQGEAVAVDNNGDVILAGTFSSNSISFGTISLQNDSISPNYLAPFLVKFSSDGAVLWAKTFTGSINSTGSSPGLRVTCDGNGNIYLLGNYQSPTLIFETDTLQSSNTFIAKYDSMGSLIWVRALSQSTNSINGCVTDNDENIYVCGSFHSDSIDFGGQILYGYDWTSPFLIKYYPSGQVIWAKGPIAGGGAAHSVAIDFSNNVCITGSYLNNLDLGSGNLPPVTDLYYHTNSFYAKYNTSGVLQWTKPIVDAWLQVFQRTMT